MKHYTLVVLLVGTLMFACKSNESKSNKQSSYDSVSNKKNTQSWVLDGNIKSDTVLVISPGGPKWELDILKHGKTIYRYIPKYNNYTIAYVHQSQTFDDRVRKLNRNLTLEESKLEVKKNTEMLSQAILFFKEKNKTVIVIGKSHGAYTVQNYISTKKGIADKYYIIAGRLTINPEMTKQQLKGFNGEFSEDGLTYLPEDENTDLSEFSEKEIREYQNKQMLKAGYGSTNYIEKLKDVNLSNVIYFYGTSDRNIGRLTNTEVDFLKSKGVKVFKADTDHSGITYYFIDKLKEGLIKL